MTRDIRATRDRLGLKTSELARLVGVGERTALRWVKGERAVPEPVWRLLRMFENAMAGLERRSPADMLSYMLSMGHGGGRPDIDPAELESVPPSQR
jgi:transcriptional regulator with XRE-family HTH domain